MHDPALPLRSPPELSLAGRLSSDERLAKLVSNGSARAFGLLYRRHHQALYRYCYAIVRNADDAQDALQSAMLRAFVALKDEHRDLAVRPWLFRIVHNEAVSLLRRRRPDVQLEDQLEPSGAGTEHAWELREQLAALVVDLQALTERQRSALVMRELSGLSMKEIAEALSISPGAAKQALFEARCALQEFSEGRAMECDAVRRVLSDGDGRALHGHKIRGHLRSCQSCDDFQRKIGERQAAWRALAPPLPTVAASAMLARLLAHGGHGGHAAGTVAASGIAVAKPGASLAVKVLAGVAVVAVTATGGARLALNHGSHARAKRTVPAAGRLSRPPQPTGVSSGRIHVTSAAAGGAARAGAGGKTSPSAPGLAPPVTSSAGAPQAAPLRGASRAGIHNTGSAAHRHSLHGRPTAGRHRSRRGGPAHHANPLASRPAKPKPATARSGEPARGLTGSTRSRAPGQGVTGPA